MGTSQSHCPKRHQRREKYADGTCDGKPLPPGKTIPRGKPTPPSEPIVTDVTHNSVTLAWQPPRRPGMGGSTVFAYTVEMSSKASSADPKAWRVLSKSCQGNSYQAKNLESGMQYVFRVRAENIHGVSKPSRPSEPAETKAFGVDQPGFVPAPEEHRASRASHVPRHQPSISLHLEGTVTSLLNHTDIQVKTNNAREVRAGGGRGEGGSEDGGDGSSSPKSDDGRVRRSLETLTGSRDDPDGPGQGRAKWRSASLQRDGNVRSSLPADRLRANSLQRDMLGRSSLQQHQPDRWTKSLQRDANQRSSLQMPCRKRSLPILLPGTRTDSLNKLRDSQTFPVTSRNREGSVENASSSSTRLKRGLGGGSSWRDRSGSDVETTTSIINSNSGGGVSGSLENCAVIVEMDGQKKSESNGVITGDLKPPKRDSGLEEDECENPWERGDDSASSELSDAVDVMVSGSEEGEGTISRKAGSEPVVSSHSHSQSPGDTPGWLLFGVSPGPEAGQADFRMLRRVLHSDDIIVKPSHSLPDIGGVRGKTSPHNTLSTILDLEEEEDSVRITTL